MRRICATRSQVAAAPSTESSKNAYDGVRGLSQELWVSPQLGLFCSIFLFLVSEDSHSRMGGSDVVNCELYGEYGTPIHTWRCHWVFITWTLGILLRTL